MALPVEDLLHDFTAYVGHMTLNRMLTIYELYKQVLGVAGHIADVGVYKGGSSLLFAKLVRNYESEALTLVHGFDWFEGMRNTPPPQDGGENLFTKDSPLILEGGYKADYEDVLELVHRQGFDDILKIHKLNLITDCPAFFERHRHLKWKLVMMDAGSYEVMKAAIPHFYDRLIPGGIMIFDQYAHEFAPGETLAVSKLLPHAKVRTIPNSWMPNAYIIKDAEDYHTQHMGIRP
jgi:hypothetical protein